MITILSSLAQQESDSISRNVRLGIQYHMQQGKRKFNAHRLLGYADDGSINASEADTVRTIFRRFLEGYSPEKIAAYLSADGILTTTGRKVWNPSTILIILENEKYKGDFLMQKYYVKDFLSHNRVRNEGELPQYLIKDDHEPIVPREVFAEVQEEIQRRAYLKYTPSLLRMGSAVALEGRLECEKCSRVLRTHSSPKGIEYRCMARPKKVTRYQKGKCTSVSTTEAKRIILKAFNELPEYKNKLLRMAGKMEAFLESESSDCSAPVDIHSAAVGSSSVGNISTSPVATDQGFSEEKMKAIIKRATIRHQLFHIHMLLELIDQMDEKRLNFWKYWEPEEKSYLPSCTDYDEFLRRTKYTPPEGVLGASGRIVEFDDSFIIRYLDKVVVSSSSYTVRFKAGIDITILAADM